ncbi:hypothetical protein E1A91_A09G264700v1 [Gossypium mustelinum]|uniref:Dof zinc finger protein n=1 Tax=Gossypium mustelinum TaxID=34275 RepID=A0A5D2Y3K2_GOSMU|nr:hypothetical protein E1A91_A09G264700v1 [Gossypium mustelinum]
MQDTHSIGGGRIFSGGGGVGYGRLRPQHHQALECPRCDSLNTKFCYYNNYNLSQPRYFCKSCRRYWTKGGVLRNVPVGGGCRKARHSKIKPSATITVAAAAVQPQLLQQQHCNQLKENTHSCSKSYSLTADNFNVPATNNNNISGGSTVEASPAITSHSSLINASDSKFYENPNDLGFTEMESFTSLITWSNNETVPFGFGNVFSEQGQWQQLQQQPKTVSTGVEELRMGLLDPTVDIELANLDNRSKGGYYGGFRPLDWEGSGDQGTTLLDLSNGSFDQTYWNQNQWADQDPPTLDLP